MPLAPISSDGDASLFNFVVKDGNGVKGMVDSGLSEVPKRYVQPQEERIDKLNATLSDIPPIDLSKLDGPDHDQIVDEIARAAATLGFFQVVNHGVPIELLDSVKDAAHSFFGMPAEKKAVYCKGVSPSPLVKYGTSFAPEIKKALEWRDYVSMTYTNDDEALQSWPKEVKDVSLKYLGASLKMVRKLLVALMGKLGMQLDDAKIDTLIGSKVINMNFYPSCPDPELTIGLGNHSDVGILTTLLQDEIGGLFVKLEEDVYGKKKGEWMEIPPLPGALVINIGDALEIVTNGKYRSAEHRVGTSTKSRVSIPIFTIPKGSEKIGPLDQIVENDGVARYREVIFEEYVKHFITNVHVGKKALDFARIN